MPVARGEGRTVPLLIASNAFQFRVQNLRGIRVYGTGFDSITNCRRQKPSRGGILKLNEFLWAATYASAGLFDPPPPIRFAVPKTSRTSLAQQTVIRLLFKIFFIDLL
jgi:hypothetical protein